MPCVAEGSGDHEHGSNSKPGYPFALACQARLQKKNYEHIEYKQPEADTPDTGDVGILHHPEKIGL